MFILPKSVKDGNPYNGEILTSKDLTFHSFKDVFVSHFVQLWEPSYEGFWEVDESMYEMHEAIKLGLLTFPEMCRHLSSDWHLSESIYKEALSRISYKRGYRALLAR